MQKSLILEPEEDFFFNIDNCLYSLEQIIGARKIKIEPAPENKFFLFCFGMLFAFIHYNKEDNLKKEIIIDKKIERTPYKSFGNVALDLLENYPEILPPYIINPRKAFFISPVRKSDDDISKAIRKYKEKLLEKKIFDTIYYPLDDTNQNDIIGTRICRDNLREEASSGTIKIYYTENSKGSVFDLGMGFALKYYFDSIYNLDEKIDQRKIELINPCHIIKINPYEKFLLDLQKDQ